MFKVMVVDDEKDSTDFLKDFLGKRGINVVATDSGHKALSLILSEKPDLVLLDIHLADEISGIEVLRELKRCEVVAKVVIFSATDDEGIIKEAFSLGAFKFLKKPMLLKEFKQFVFELAGV